MLKQPSRKHLSNPDIVQRIWPNSRLSAETRADQKSLLIFVLALSLDFGLRFSRKDIFEQPYRNLLFNASDKDWAKLYVGC